MRRWLALNFACLLLAGWVVQAAQAVSPETVEIAAGDLTLLLGNEYDHGAGRDGYIGIWRLTSVEEPTNVFVPQYAGWIHRRNRATVEASSATVATIRHLESEGQPASWQTFEVIAPYYFDCTYGVTADGTSVLFNGTSYINGASNRAVYFLDHQMQWSRHFDSVHGTAASLLPTGVAVPDVKKVKNSRYPSGAAHFRDSFSETRYHEDYPVFYGRFRDMVLVHMFPPGCRVIPYMSPSGGGFQPDGKRRNPAWDWRILIVDGVAPGEEITFTMRAIYKRYVSEAEIFAEYQEWAKELQELR